MTEFKAALFDLDGTLVDNNEVHYKAWMKYLADSGIEICDEEFKKYISGRTNQDAVEHVYKKKMSTEEAEKYYLKKEEIYRQMYEADIKSINGLEKLLKELHNNGIILAIATSGIQVNIDFFFKHVPVKQYFRTVINSSAITKGKPDPEIFLVAAEAIEIPAENCIVFEDSTSGVQAAKSAGMKVVALTTTHTKSELSPADLVVDDYSQLTLEKLQKLLK
jgi:beta-phosphoglucomutase family hydrolase